MTWPHLLRSFSKLVVTAASSGQVHIPSTPLLPRISTTRFSEKRKNVSVPVLCGSSQYDILCKQITVYIYIYSRLLSIYIYIYIISIYIYVIRYCMNICSSDMAASWPNQQLQPTVIRRRARSKHWVSNQQSNFENMSGADDMDNFWGSRPMWTHHCLQPSSGLEHVGHLFGQFWPFVDAKWFLCWGITCQSMLWRALQPYTSASQCFLVSRTSAGVDVAPVGLPLATKVMAWILHPFLQWLDHWNQGGCGTVKGLVFHTGILFGICRTDNTWVPRDTVIPHCLILFLADRLVVIYFGSSWIHMNSYISFIRWTLSIDHASSARLMNGVKSIRSCKVNCGLPKCHVRHIVMYNECYPMLRTFLREVAHKQILMEQQEEPPDMCFIYSSYQVMCFIRDGLLGP